MQKKLQWALLASLAIILAVWFIGYSPFSKTPLDRSPRPEAYEPAALKNQNSPLTQEKPGEGQKDVGAPPAVLQKDIDPNAHKVSLELDTMPDTPSFKQDKLSVGAGEVVELRFHNSSDPKLNSLHNFVLVQPHTEGKVATEAARVGPAGNFLADSADILAHSQMLKPGESETVVFKAPTTEGDYPYLCTFPGHSEPMRGMLKVTAPHP